MMVLRSVLLAALLDQALSLSTTIVSTPIYQGLASTPLWRASDGAPVTLPSLWRSNTAFGVADEYAVCAFLRHFG